MFSSCKESERSEGISFVDNFQKWYKGGNANWEFVNGELIGGLDSGSGFVMTNEIYKNFELSLEFFPDSTINSGIFLRCNEKNISAIRM